MGSVDSDSRVRRSAIRILVVEDEEPVRIPMVEFMRLRGYHVDSAADGQEGLEALRRQRYEVCVVDLLMPRMNGEEFMSEARKVQPISAGYRKLLESSDVLKVLQKPFPLEKLNRIIEEAFS